MPVGSTAQRSVQVSGFDDVCRLTPLRRLYPLPVRQAGSLPSASFGFPVARDTLAARLTLPLAGCVEDLHLPVAQPATIAAQAALARSAPCLAHNDKGRTPCALLASPSRLNRPDGPAALPAVASCRSSSPALSRTPGNRSRCCGSRGTSRPTHAPAGRSDSANAAGARSGRT